MTLMMPTRPLGSTGMHVGVIGLGTEYLRTRETAVATIRAALDAGVNFFDVLMPMPDYRDSMGEAFRGRRHEAILTCHLGASLKEGQWSATREPELAESYFEDWLRRLGTDYADVIVITCVDKQQDYETAIAPGGVMDLAQRLVQQGKGRAIGISGHDAPVALRAIESGWCQVVIHGCNLKWPADAIGRACAERGIGFVAMKPYGGGELFHPPYSDFVTPVRALAHVLGQPGVSTVIPGVANVAELEAALRYLGACEAERDTLDITANFSERIRGTCTACGHCLPCAAGIAINDVLYAYRGLGWGLSYAPDMARGLADMPGKCLACGDCMTRCPFEVDVPAQMRAAAAAFAAYGKRE
jgi:predicted aldo/keto reductase-like oxidoreductase